MKNDSAMLIILAAATLGLAGCPGDDGNPSNEGSSTGDPNPTTTGPMESTGMPTPGTTSTGPDPSTSNVDTSTGDPDTSTGEPVELTCEAYCDIYEEACQDFSEYANTQDCLDNCAQWPIGLPEDTEGDSLGCRIYHVTVANSTDPNIHCPHSGPSGDGVCVAEDAPTCDLYCMRYFNNCMDELNLWMDMQECLDTCATWYPGTDTDNEGDTIGCRSYYANLAAADPDLHCPNAGPGGGDQCILPGA